VKLNCDEAVIDQTRDAPMAEVMSTPQKGVSASFLFKDIVHCIQDAHCGE
jgi:hypothetical protein